MTALHLAIKLSLRVSIDEATHIHSLPDLQSVITDYFSWVGHLVEPAEKMQVWFKVQVQLLNYHDPQLLEPPQSPLTLPPLAQFLIGWYDFAIISQTDESDWLSNGLRGMLHGKLSYSYAHHLSGHEVVQIWLIFCLLQSNTFLAYIQCFNATSPPPLCNSTDGAAGMHILKCTIKRNGS